MASKLKTEQGEEGHGREPGSDRESRFHSAWFCSAAPRAPSAF